MNLAYTAIMNHLYSEVKCLNPPDFKGNKESCLAFAEYVKVNKDFPEFLGFDDNNGFKVVLDKAIPQFDTIIMQYYESLSFYKYFRTQGNLVDDKTG